MGCRGLVFKAHRRLYHSTLGLRVVKNKKVQHVAVERDQEARGCLGNGVRRRSDPLLVTVKHLCSKFRCQILNEK